MRRTSRSTAAKRAFSWVAIGCAALLLALAQGALAAPAPTPGPPTAATGAAEAIQSSTATVTGTVDPHASATSYYFEYGPTAAYGTQTSAASAGEGTSGVPVHQGLSGLAPGTTYHYRLVAVGDGATVVGDDLTFTTAKAPAITVTTGAAGAVTSTTATLTGSIDSHGVATSYYFQFGVRSLSASTPIGSAGASSATVAVSATLAGLAPGTTYLYRLVAVGAATIDGSTRSFTTAKVPASLSLVSALNPVGAGTSATFTGTLSGTGASARSVALEIEPFPFTSGFQQLGGAELVGASGQFSFTLPDLTLDTMVRAVTVGGTPALTSPTTLERALVRVSLHIHRHRHSLRFIGLVAPAGAPVRIEIQRRSRDHWTTMAYTSTHPIPGGLAAFARTITHARPGHYRVLALVLDGSLLPGRSGVLDVG
jgi:hypothetical protein